MKRHPDAAPAPTADSPPRIAICTASVGHGHSRASHAIADALRQMRPDAHIDIIDALAIAPAWFVHAYRDAYLAGISRLPALAGWLYDASDRPPSTSGLGSTFERLALRQLAHIPEVARADVVICTHFLCGRVLSAARGARTLSVPLTICITDQHPHGVWLAPHADRILVASDDARQTAISAGIPAERIGVTGIPIDIRFRTPMPRHDARAAFHLPLGRPIALVSGGGLGLGGMEQTVRALMDSRAEIHIVAVCGHNQACHAQLLPLARPPAPGAPSCDILGFTEHMPTLMAAADVLIGKPGGLTTAEALARHLPMILIRPIPGQEERNAARLTQAGAAILERDPHRAGVLAATLLTDPARLESMRQVARTLAQSDSAFQAAAQVLNGLTSPTRAVAQPAQAPSTPAAPALAAV